MSTTRNNPAAQGETDAASVYPYLIVLQFCGNVLQSPPDKALLRHLHEHRLFADWPLQPASKEAAAALKELARDNSVAPYDAAALRQDHLLLFSGPTPVARPWESVWREKDQLLFGEQTALVRECYQRWGLAAEDAGHSPEDHLGLELAFCAVLLHKAVEEGNAAALPALAAFLDEHLLQWAEPCLRAVAASEAGNFYRCLAPLCLDALSSLRSQIRAWQETN